MLTRLTARNFKRFGEVEVELGNPVVFIGPNNSGKTSAMQALALWDIGLKRWNEKRSGINAPEKRPGVTVNRRDLVAIPIPDANLLWRRMHVRDVRRVDGRQTTSNVRIDLVVEGVTRDRRWTCGLEFDYANEESFYCRPLRLAEGKAPDRMPVPAEAADTRIAFLPPMSGLAATETRLDQGAVNVRLGEGRTAEVLRNLCFRIHEHEPERWGALVGQVRSLFGSEIEPPRYVAERGEIAMTYQECGAAALRDLLRQARPAEPDGQEELLRAGSVRTGRRDRPGNPAQARCDRECRGACDARGRSGLNNVAISRLRRCRQTGRHERLRGNQ